MARDLAWLAAACVLSACVSPSDGQFTCPNPGDRCPEGQTCVAGRCVVGGPAPDAGRDAAPDERDGGPDAGGDAGPDAGPPCVGTDEDGDGSCLEDDPPDCDDTRATVFPGQATDECVGELRDGEGRDNDCDGAIDEGCPLSIGVSHIPLALHTRPTAAVSAPLSVRSPAMGASGERVYLVRAEIGANHVSVASRAASGDSLGEFGAPGPVAGELPPTVGTITITGDERTLFYDTTDPGVIWRSTRAGIASPFETPATVTSPSSMTVQPSVTRDGRELFATELGGSSSLVHLRLSDAGLVEATTALAMAGPGASNPQISADGLTLYFTVGAELRALSRRSRADEFDESPALAPEPLRDLLGARGVRPLLHAETREVWFTQPMPSLLEAPDLQSVLWRAHSCREESCPESFDACDGVSNGEPTPDGLHCFYQGSTNVAPPDAFAACAAGDHAATVHLPSETAALIELGTNTGGDPLWIGFWSPNPGPYFVWLNGEPSVGDNFDVTPPADRPRYTIFRSTAPMAGTWNTEPPGTAFDVACEREIWPTWPTLGD